MPVHVMEDDFAAMSRNCILDMAYDATMACRTYCDIIMYTYESATRYNLGSAPRQQ